MRSKTIELAHSIRVARSQVLYGRLNNLCWKGTVGVSSSPTSNRCFEFVETEIYRELLEMIRNMTDDINTIQIFGPKRDRKIAPKSLKRLGSRSTRVERTSSIASRICVLPCLWLHTQSSPVCNIHNISQCWCTHKGTKYDGVMAL